MRSESQFEAEHPPAAGRVFYWPLWLSGVVASLGISVIVGLVTLFGAASTCGEVPTHRNLVDGLGRLLAATVLLTLPWAVVALVYRRQRRRVAVGWLIGVAPLLFLVVTHLHASNWVGGFCF